MGRSKTTEPVFAELAHQRSHDVVLDRTTGAWITLKAFMGDGDYGDVVERKRVELQLKLDVGQPRYVCPWCEDRMTLKSLMTRDHTVRRFYFKHSTRGNPCTGDKGLSAAQICARKFAHSKEGTLHKQFKVWLVESLNADPAFSGTELEARWKDVQGVKWRQPDVQSTWGERRIAFEAQLSTTFLHVIAERIKYYKRNDGHLLWLFRHLDPECLRMAEHDILYSNNRNGFCITPETVALSREQRRFALQCMWLEPIQEGDGIRDDATERTVFFDELHFDESKIGVPRVYFSDYDGKRAALELKMAQQGEGAVRALDQELRDEMEAYFVAGKRGKWDGTERHWQALRARFKLRGFSLPDRIYRVDGPLYLLMAAYSAKHGEVLGCALKNFTSLANNLFDRHKNTLWVFSVMMRHYKRSDEMRAHGNVPNWLSRVARYRQAWSENDPEFAPDRRFDGLLSFLFPEAAEELIRAPCDLARSPRGD